MLWVHFKSVMITISDCKCKIKTQVFFVAVTLTVAVAPKDNSTAAAAVLEPSAEAVWWICESKTFGKYKSFTHQSMLIYGPGCSSPGRAIWLVIGGLLSSELSCMSKCPWARYWTPIIHYPAMTWRLVQVCAMPSPGDIKPLRPHKRDEHAIWGHHQRQWNPNVLTLAWFQTTDNNYYSLLFCNVNNWLQSWMCNSSWKK